MTTNLTWRLGKLPTPEEVLKLVTDKIITKEEARSMLFTEKDEEDIDKDEKIESLKEEIKFLRELTQKLSSNRTKIVETIRTIEKPYYNYHWYKPYYYWASDNTYAVYSTADNGIVNAVNTYNSSSNQLQANLNGSSSISQLSSSNADFTEIKTF